MKPQEMEVRTFQPGDAAAVNALALSAFIQYKDEYREWDTFSQNIQKMSLLSAIGEIIIAEKKGKICGAVGYVGANQPRAEFFDPGWSIIRMLVVDPECRGMGIGRRLTEECIDRARQDKVPAIALHTSPIMEVAFSMYMRMGFSLVGEAPAMHGVQYGVYAKKL